MRKIDPVLFERLAKLIGSMGYELVGCEMVPQGRLTVFRIYIDSEKGVSVDDCSLVSRQVSAMMDVEDPIQNRYSLEISSPGIDRPLFEIEHFHKFIGKQVRIKLHVPVNQRKQYKGTLQRIEGEDIFLLVDGIEEEVKLSFAMMDKANVVGEVKF